MASQAAKNIRAKHGGMDPLDALWDDVRQALDEAGSDTERAEVEQAGLDAADAIDGQTARQLFMSRLEDWAEAQTPRPMWTDRDGEPLDIGEAPDDPEFRMVRDAVAAASSAQEAQEIVAAALVGSDAGNELGHAPTMTADERAAAERWTHHVFNLLEPWAGRPVDPDPSYEPPQGTVPDTGGDIELSDVGAGDE